GAAKYAKALDTCNKSINKTFGGLAKFRTKFDALFAKGQCAAGNLRVLGFLQGPVVLAPGVNVQAWVQNVILVNNFQFAIQNILIQNIQFFNIIQQFKIVIGETCQPGTLRPDLCAFDIQCRTHSCWLSASSQTTTSTLGGTLGGLYSGVPI